MATRLGEMLVKAGALSSEQLLAASEFQKNNSCSLVSAIQGCGFLTEEKIIQDLNQNYGTPILELNNIELSHAAATLVPIELANKHKLVPIVQEDQNLKIAMADPYNNVAINEIKFQTGLELDIFITTETIVTDLITRTYQNGESTSNSQNQRIAEEEGLTESDIEDYILSNQDTDEYNTDSSGDDFNEEELSENIETDEVESFPTCEETYNLPVEMLAYAYLRSALKDGATEIHFCENGKQISLNLRLNGKLVPKPGLPKLLKSPLFKSLIAINDTVVSSGDNSYLVKINLLNFTSGAKLAVHFSSVANSENCNFGTLGLKQNQIDAILPIKHIKSGLILVVANSEDTLSHTILSLVQELNSPDKNVYALSCADHSFLDGVNHLNIASNNSPDLWQGIRNQYPDIVSIDNLFQLEKPEEALKSALSEIILIAGVLSTNSAQALAQLIAEPSWNTLIATSLRLVITQQKLRKLCECSSTSEQEPDLFLLEHLGYQTANCGNQLKVPVGCSTCENTGYSGWLHLFEVVPAKSELRKIFISNPSEEEIATSVKNNAVSTLEHEALDVLNSGQTTIEEIIRVSIKE